MDPRDRQRRAEPIPVARLKPPSGGPAALYRLARRERVRALLGRELGPHLLDWRREEGRIVLVFAGSGWERALTPLLEAVAGDVARVLGCPGLSVVAESRDGAPPTASGAPRSAREAPRDAAERRERLRALAQKMLERRRDTRTHQTIDSDGQAQ